jgi:hypothetical protein
MNTLALQIGGLILMPLPTKDCMYSTVVADFVFSTQSPWAILPCPPKIYLSYAGGQRRLPPIAVEVHYPRTSARLMYFTM